MTVLAEPVADAPYPAAADPVLEIRDLHLTFPGVAPVRALRGVSLSINPGEVVGLVGESGSGKTVLGLAALGLLPPVKGMKLEGCVRLGGLDMATAPEAERRAKRGTYVGAVFQDPMAALNPSMQIGRQVAEAAGGAEDDVVIALLSDAGIPSAHERLRQYPHEAVLGTYTNFVNLMELCAVAVPAGLRGDGLPFGVSLIAPWGGDDLLLRLAAAWLGEEAEAPEAGCGALLAVVGAHLRGQPLNGQLTHLGATLEALTHTAPLYRLYELADARPAKPGLVRVGKDPGYAIEVEVWRIDPEGLSRLLAETRQPLSIGTVELADGSSAAGFVCDSRVAETCREITAWGGWRAYLAGQAPP